MRDTNRKIKSQTEMRRTGWPDVTVNKTRPHTKEARRARVLEDDHIFRVVAHIDATSTAPVSDTLKFSLSVYAGLRVGEIAGMTVDDLTDASGNVARHVAVGRHIAKGGRERSIPMHPYIREAVVRFRAVYPEERYVCLTARWGKPRRQKLYGLNAWFTRLYVDCGLTGCSSHSGRRTFITNMARAANHHNRSLRDVQLLAGHARLNTTEAYIEPADDLAALVEGFIPRRSSANDNQAQA